MRFATIPVVGAGSLGVTTLAVRLPQSGPNRTIIVKGTFDIVPNEAARPAKEPAVLSGDVEGTGGLGLSYASDFAAFKPRADVTLVGYAYARRGRATTSAVRFRFGRRDAGFDRTVAVFGDRTWQGGALRAVASDAAGFDRIPLGWHRAFGGPSRPSNPIGRGADATSLPNLENPNDLVRAPDDVRAPACFAPIPMTWEERWSKLGTYDEAWTAQGWPWFPADFDPSFFQHAPVAQQLPWLEGNESFDVVGASADERPLSGSLPGLRPRCFVTRSKPEGEFHEVVLRLDTVQIDAEAGRIDLVWRGLCPTSDDVASDVAELFILHERVDGPRTSLEEALVRSRVEKEAVATAEDAAATTDAADNDEASAAAPSGPAVPTPEEEAAVAEWASTLAAGIAAAGVPASFLVGEPPKGAAPPPPKWPSSRKLARQLKRAGVPDDEIGTVVGAFERAKKGPPTDDEPVIDPTKREAVIVWLDHGAPFDGADLEGADLSDLDLSGRSFSGASFFGAKLHRTKLDGAKLDGARLERADLEGASLKRASLEGADLTRAKLERAILSEAVLEGASFEGASARGARLDRTKGGSVVLSDVDLSDAVLDGAELPGVDLTRAVLDRTSFRGAKLAELRLYDAKGSSTVFDDADLTGARADGVTLVSGSLCRIAAKGSVWENANVERSTFTYAVLDEASFVTAGAEGADFGAVSLRNGRLDGAKLRRSTFLTADLMEASFEGADLEGSDLRASSLYAAATWQAKTGGAQTELAHLDATRLAKGLS